MKDVLNMSVSSGLGIRESSNPAYLIEIDFNSEQVNHLGYFHASVIFSFAEICSGCFLAKYFPEEKEITLPVLRAISGKFSSPSKGKLFAKCHLHQDTISAVSCRLNKNNKAKFKIITDVFNIEEKLVFRGQFDWFVRRKEVLSAKTIVKTSGDD